MSRVKRGNKRLKRRKKILAKAKGYYGAKSKSHRVAKLAVEWEERIACLLCDDLAVRRLRFLDLIQEEANEIDSDDALARFDADFALMGRELTHFLNALIKAYGGMDEDN